MVSWACRGQRLKTGDKLIHLPTRHTNEEFDPSFMEFLLSRGDEFTFLCYKVIPCFHAHVIRSGSARLRSVWMGVVWGGGGLSLDPDELCSVLNDVNMILSQLQGINWSIDLKPERAACGSRLATNVVKVWRFSDICFLSVNTWNVKQTLLWLLLCVSFASVPNLRSSTAVRSLLIHGFDSFSQYHKLLPHNRYWGDKTVWFIMNWGSNIQTLFISLKRVFTSKCVVH